MKKVAVLFVLFAVLCVSAPSYGYLLIYNMSGSYKTVDTDANTLYKSSYKGYLIMDINDATHFVDRSKGFFYGKNLAGSKAYVPYDDVLNSLGTWGGQMLAEFYMNKQGFHAVLIGKEKDVPYSSTEAVIAATSLKGSLIFPADGYLLDSTQHLIGPGTTSMSFISKRTKLANDNNETYEAIVAEYQALLESKGYVLGS